MNWSNTVVADEFRYLAIRTADAAKRTAEMSEGTVSMTKVGRKLVGTTNEAFIQVAQSASKVSGVEKMTGVKGMKF